MAFKGHKHPPRPASWEALRRLNHSKALYERHLEKNRRIEAEYRATIANVEDRIEELEKEEPA